MLSARHVGDSSRGQWAGLGPRPRRGGGVHGQGPRWAKGAVGCRQSPRRVGLPSAEQSQRDAVLPEDKKVSAPHPCCRDVLSKSKIKVSRREWEARSSQMRQCGGRRGAQLLGAALRTREDR